MSELTARTNAEGWEVGGDVKGWPIAVPCYNVDLGIHVYTSMALNIRNPEAERLATALSKLTGETKTAAVTRALQDRLARLRRERAGRRLADELDDIARHCAQLPVRDSRSADEILGYDEHGLPS